MKSLDLFKEIINTIHVPNNFILNRTSSERISFSLKKCKPYGQVYGQEIHFLYLIYNKNYGEFQPNNSNKFWCYIPYVNIFHHVFPNLDRYESIISIHNRYHEIVFEIGHFNFFNDLTCFMNEVFIAAAPLAGAATPWYDGGAPGATEPAADPAKEIK